MKKLAEELRNETVKTLLVLAKDHGIKGRHALRKPELIDALLKSVKLVYLRKAVPGRQVAFRKEGTEKVRNGKIIGNDGEQYLNVETGHGKVCKVPYDDVLWVKTGKRWPSWVYEQLKK